MEKQIRIIQYPFETWYFGLEVDGKLVGHWCNGLEAWLPVFQRYCTVHASGGPEQILVGPFFATEFPSYASCLEYEAENREKMERGRIGFPPGWEELAETPAS